MLAHIAFCNFAGKRLDNIQFIYPLTDRIPDKITLNFFQRLSKTKLKMLKYFETSNSCFDPILTVHGSKLIEFGESQYLPASLHIEYIFCKTPHF